MDQLASCIFMLYTLYINNMYILREGEKREMEWRKRDRMLLYPWFMMIILNFKINHNMRYFL